MDISFYNPEKSDSSIIEKDILSVFKPDNTADIQRGMSPKEIAEVTSNHLIDIIKQQFEVAKNNYHREV